MLSCLSVFYFCKLVLFNYNVSQVSGSRFTVVGKRVSLSGWNLLMAYIISRSEGYLKRFDVVIAGYCRCCEAIFMAF